MAADRRAGAQQLQEHAVSIAQHAVTLASQAVAIAQHGVRLDGNDKSVADLKLADETNRKEWMSALKGLDAKFWAIIVIALGQSAIWIFRK